MENLIPSAAGAVIGFVLAQLVNFGKILFNYALAPRLKIEVLPNCRLLMHHIEIENGEVVREEMYGFEVKNVGRRVAADVKCQLLKVEFRDKAKVFQTAVEQTFHLKQYNSSNRHSGTFSVTLVPKASATFHLATSRADRDVIQPAIQEPLDYFEEACFYATTFRFTVVAYDKDNRWVTKTLTVDV